MSLYGPLTHCSVSSAALCDTKLSLPPQISSVGHFVGSVFHELSPLTSIARYQLRAAVIEPFSCMFSAYREADCLFRPVLVSNLVRAAPCFLVNTHSGT